MLPMPEKRIFPMKKPVALWIPGWSLVGWLGLNQRTWYFAGILSVGVFLSIQQRIGGEGGRDHLQQSPCSRGCENPTGCQNEHNIIWYVFFNDNSKNQIRIYSLQFYQLTDTDSPRGRTMVLWHTDTEFKTNLISITDLSFIFGSPCILSKDCL